MLIGIERLARGEYLVASLLLSVSIACGFGLARLERGSASPVISIDLFRRLSFSLSSATAVCAFAVQGAAFVALPFHLQTQFAFSQVQTGYLLTAWPACGALMAILAPPVAERMPPALLASVGLLLLSGGMALLYSLPAGAEPIAVVWRLSICGIGFGLFQSPNMHAIMSAAPMSRSGGASGILAASRLVGQSLGAALVAYLMAVAVTNGAQRALLLASLIGVFAALVSSARLLPHIRKGQ
jgi:DHA2 family multidrug resistance protein-like MFS transporter